MNRVFVVLVVVAVLAALVRDAMPDATERAVFDTDRPDLVGVAADSALRALPPPPMPAMKALTDKSLDSAKGAAALAIGLIGVLALWSGLMRVAEKAGLVALLARALRPVLTRLFPDVPPDHPAMGAIVMNMSANLLGLGNAATPLGLAAMKHLQELNVSLGGAKKTASNAMVMFLALNTTHLTLIPARTIALRLENKSLMATNIVVPTILATACGMIVAITVAKLLEKRFPVTPDPIDPTTTTPSAEAA
ncbi:MAG: nucleoside recognition domain-containing protein [Deltaproteobacteria bacterium]|nr:nucleoside recognition domain-containing protein [Deltaproteobacteria bacterium]